MAKKRITEKELVKICNRAIERYKGDAGELEKAIGVLTVGRQVGWKPLLLMHTKQTIRKYEKVLGVTFKDCLPEEGRLAYKSIGYNLSKAVGNFWKAVSGEIKGIRSVLFDDEPPTPPAKGLK